MAYRLFVCPVPGCGREELAAKPPHYSDCPQCHKPAGDFLPKPEPEPGA